VPIILFALLVFVLLALAGVVLLSLALRYRAGTARRQARRWVASLSVWMTTISAIFFLLFTALLSFWLDAAFRFAQSARPLGQRAFQRLPRRFGPNSRFRTGEDKGCLTRI